MSNYSYKITFLAILFSAMSFAGPTLKPGRYAGYIYLPEAGMKLPTILDTVHVPPNRGENTKLAAYVKVLWGAFRSHEYVVHPFFVPDYDWTSKEMTLAAGATGYTKDLSLNTTIEENGERIRGKVSSARVDFEGGELDLVYLSPPWLAPEDGKFESKLFDSEKIAAIFPKIPIYPLLTGSYSSGCHTHKTLMFELTKHTGLTPESALTMEGYTIRGRITGTLDNQSYGVIRNMNNFSDIIYSPFHGTIDFPHNSLQMCTRTPDSIECRGCKFKAREDEKPFLASILDNDHRCRVRPFYREIDATEENVTYSTLTKDLQNVTYRGYIHFEERDKVRPFSIRVDVAGLPFVDDPTIAERTLTFTPQIHLQNFGAKRAKNIPIPLNPMRLGNPKAPQIVVGPGGNLIQIIRWTKNSITGVAYSGMSGRLGTFQVFRDSIAQPPINLEFTVPGIFLAKPQKLADEKNSRGKVIERGSVVQEQIALEWVNNLTNFPAPHTIGGLFTMYWDNPQMFVRNTFDDLLMRNVRYDTYTGVVGADVSSASSSGANPSSFFIILGEDELRVVRVADFFSADEQVVHRPVAFRRDEPYLKVRPPSGLQPGAMHLMMPFDAGLEINGQVMVDQEGLMYRSYNWPKDIPDDKEISYVIKASFFTGRTITETVKFTGKQIKERVILVDFFQLQDRKSKEF